MIYKINKQSLLEESLNINTKYLANNNTPQDRIGSIVGGLASGGLAGGGLAAYGNMSNQTRQYQTADKSLVDSNGGDIGPWDKSMIARGQYFNNIDNRSSNLYDTNKTQYFLNPMVAGPITHTIIKGSRDVNNGVYKALKNQSSPDIENKVTVIADPNAPFNSGVDTIRNSANNYADDIATIRRRNPGHYFLNPFVAGPVNEFIGGHLTGAIAQGVRKISSPTTNSGDTLVYNTGRR